MINNDGTLDTVECLEYLHAKRYINIFHLYFMFPFYPSSFLLKQQYLRTLQNPNI